MTNHIHLENSSTSLILFQNLSIGDLLPWRLVSKTICKLIDEKVLLLEESIEWRNRWLSGTEKQILAARDIVIQDLKTKLQPEEPEVPEPRLINDEVMQAIEITQIEEMLQLPVNGTIKIVNGTFKFADGTFKIAQIIKAFSTDLPTRLYTMLLGSLVTFAYPTPLFEILSEDTIRKCMEIISSIKEVLKYNKMMMTEDDVKMSFKRQIYYHLFSGKSLLLKLPIIESLPTNISDISSPIMRSPLNNDIHDWFFVVRVKKISSGKMEFWTFHFNKIFKKHDNTAEGVDTNTKAPSYLFLNELEEFIKNRKNVKYEIC